MLIRHIVALAALLACALQPAGAGTLDPAGIKETVFPSGLRLIVKDSSAADLASVQVWIRAGGFLETQQTSGTAHVIEHLLFKASDSSAPGTLDGEIEGMGGLLEASTEKDYTRLSCTVAGRYVPRALQAIGRALRQPVFDARALDEERPILQEEAAGIVLNPETHLTSLLYGMAYARHPYRLDVRGSREFLRGIHVEAVRAYFQRHYVPRNMVVVIAGNVDPGTMVRVVQREFPAEAVPGLPAPEPLPEDEFAGGTPARRVLNVPLSNAYVGLAYPAPSVRDQPEVHAMDVILTLLEHQGSGRLPRLARNTAGVRAVFETRRQAGVLLVTAAVRAGTPDALESVLRKEIAFLADNPVPEAELSLAKRLLRGSYIFDVEPFSGQAGTLGYYAIIDRWQFASEYLDRVEAVTPADVQAVARKYLRDDRCCAVLFRPVTAPEPPRGPVTCAAENSVEDAGPADMDGRSAVPGRPPAKPPVRAEPIVLPPARKRTPVSVSTLANGLRLLCRPNDSSEIVSIVCQVRAGLSAEGDRAGLAALTAEVIARGSADYPGESFGGAALAAGGIPRVMPGHDLAEFSIVTSKTRFEGALKLLAACLARPRIDAAQVTEAREALKRRYQVMRDDYTGASYQALLNLLHPHGPYGRSVIGYPASLDRLGPEDVRRFYEAHFTQNRMVVAIVGDVQPSEALALSGKAFADLPFRPGIATTPRDESLPAPAVEAIRRQGPAAQVMLGFPAPPVTRDNYAVHAVLDALIGGGKQARLFRNVREKKRLGYEQCSFYQPLLLRSHLVAYVITPPYLPDPATNAPGLTLEPVRAEMFRQFRELADPGPTQEELGRAIAFAVGRHALRGERNLDQARWLAWFEAMGLGKDFEEEFPARAAAVTLPQIRQAAQRLLQSHAVVVTLPADPRD